MEKQYCVCINFGYETTTASYIDLTAVYSANKEGTYDVPKLNILNGSTDRHARLKLLFVEEKTANGSLPSI